MAMDPMDRDPNVYDRRTDVHVEDRRGSNTLAYVIGGLVIALGLLAFLFYGGDRDEVTTTGSTAVPVESAPATPPATEPVTPAAPVAPAPVAPPPAAPANPQ